MNFLYLSFGDHTHHHIQAIYSILSLMKYVKKQNQKYRIHVYTDRPNYYQILSDYIQVTTLDSKQLIDWQGPQKFFWRIKIRALQEVSRQNPQQGLCYLDADTIFYKNLPSEFSSKAYMHMNEGKLSNLSSKTERLMWSQLQGTHYHSLKMSPQDCMWNAGLIAIPPQNQQACLELALNLCDEMCARGVTRRLIEQYAFSLALVHYHKTSLHEAKDFVAHYWGNKPEWTQHIEKLLAQAYVQQKSINQVIEDIDPLSDIKEKPIWVKTSKVQQKFAQLGHILKPSKRKYALTEIEVK
jgi:hypothetical protein